jgi:hypothetical protein
LAVVGNFGDFGNLLRRRFALRHHDIVLGLAFSSGIHGGYADKVVLFCVEFDGRLADFGRDSGESCFALSIGVNAHFELVRAKGTIRQMDINVGGAHRFAVSVSYREFDGAGAGRSIRDGNIVGLLWLGRLLTTYRENQSGPKKSEYRLMWLGRLVS